jgi:hypothetical protein
MLNLNNETNQYTVTPSLFSIVQANHLTCTSTAIRLETVTVDVNKVKLLLKNLNQ